jgi:hypothetical protein
MRISHFAFGVLEIDGTTYVGEKTAFFGLPTERHRHHPQNVACNFCGDPPPLWIP